MTQTKRPNILFLFTDQQRADSIGALGNSFAQTPHLDRLCREGTAFTSAYTPSPECVPARACLITGQYVNRHGCGCNEQSMPPVDTATFMSRLTDAGYRTHGVGKCHFTPDPEALRGFQSREISEEICGPDERNDYLDFVQDGGYGHVLEPLGVRGEMYYIPQPAQLPAELHHSHWVAERCRGFIQDQAENSQPWMLYGGFVHPHPPFNPPNPWHKLFRAPDMPLPHLPPDYESLLCFINRFQNRYKYRDRGMDLNLIRCIRAYYHACISFLDSRIGQILETLEETGQLDNTLIVFSSDHGELLGDFGSFGKRSFHDAAARIPLIARWPGQIPEGKQCSTPVSLVDLAPTFSRAGEAESMPSTDGLDLCAVANGTIDREAVFSQYNRGDNCLAMAFSREYKYAWSAPDQREYLFRRNDSPETQDLAGSPGHEDSQDHMRTKLIQHIEAGNFASEILDSQIGFRQVTIRSMPTNPDAGLIFQDPANRELSLPPPYGTSHPQN